MSSDDQYEYFLEVLSAIPSDVRRYSLEVADSIDRHFETVAVTLRETLASSPWVPEAARPSLPPRPPPPPPVPTSLYQRAEGWVLENKLLTATILASVGITSIAFYRRRRHYGRKRRAHRASNGARKEVVVVAGDPREPITRSISSDLERRGFLVYIVASSSEEEQIVKSLAWADTKPLSLDITDPTDVDAAIERFQTLLRTPQHAFPGAEAHALRLAGVVIIPDTAYPTGPLEAISPERWSDVLNVMVLATVATTQALLRLLHTSRDARVLFLTPSIVSSLAPPFHSPEATVGAALDAFTRSVASELATVGTQVTHLKLGAFDVSGVPGAKTHLQTTNAARADVLAWPASARAAYGKNYIAQSQTAAVGAAQSNSGNKGAHLRELHNAVFDALVPSGVGRARRIVHVGQGSLAYAFIGRWAPAGLVGWMMGVRRADAGGVERAWEGELDGDKSDKGDSAAGAGSVEWERVEKMV